MNSAKIILSQIAPIINEDDVLDLLWDYFGCLYKNGQILKNYEIVKQDTNFLVFVTLPGSDALDDNNNSIYASKYLGQVRELFDISIEIIGENMNYDNSCTCNKSSWYMLYTDYAETDSPVVCGDCGKSVSLYKLPYLFNENEHHSILGWKEAYSEIDSLWMYCLSDRFTYRQLNKLDSQLSKIGLDICKQIEKATDIPTYYYLFHARGLWHTNNTPAECPSCGKNWRLSCVETFIDYKCDQCRLVADEV